MLPGPFRQASFALESRKSWLPAVCKDSWQGKDSCARSRAASLVGSKCLSGCSYRKREEPGAGGGAVW